MLKSPLTSVLNKMGQLKKFEFLSLGIKTPREKLHIYYCFLNFSCVYYIVIKICKHFTYKEFFFIRRKKKSQSPLQRVFCYHLRSKLAIGKLKISLYCYNFLNYSNQIICTLQEISWKPGKTSNFRPIHSTIQIWTDFHENEAKKKFFWWKKFKMADFSKWPFFTNWSLG